MNLVILHTDQQRFDSLGCTGNSHAETPNIDRLTDGGRLYTRCFSTNPVCMPSRASLLSGLYPAGHGVWNNGIPLPRAEHVISEDHDRRLQQSAGVFPPHPQTLADILSKAGYTTHSVGKLHLTPTESSAQYGLPESRWLWEGGARSEWSGPYYGFDTVELSLHHGERVTGHYGYWLEDTYPVVAEQVYGNVPPALNLPGSPAGIRPGLVPEKAHHSTWCADRAVAYLDSVRGAQEPFFLWVGFPDPHSPWTPPALLAEKFTGNGSRPSTFDKPRPRSPGLAQLEGRGIDLRAAGGDATTVQRIREYTDAQIHLIDRSVGRILDRLADNGQLQDTVVVFTSDHGDFLGDYGFIRKAGYPGRVLCNVPLIIRFPWEGEGSVVHRAVSQVDLLPTLVDALGIESASDFASDGISLLGGVPDDHAALVQTFVDRESRSFTLVDDQYRLTYYPHHDQAELYDHQQDPYELMNLASDGRHGRDPLIAGQLERLFEAHLRTVNPQSGWLATW